MDRDQVRAAFEDPKEFTTSPLYRCLSRTVAATGELVDLACQGRPGQYPTFLFFGALHLLLLAGTDHPLARFYPSVAAPGRCRRAAPGLSWFRSAGSMRRNSRKRSAPGSCRPIRSSERSACAWACP